MKSSSNGQAHVGWLTQAADLWPRLVRASREEVEPLVPRKALAEAAGVILPQQSFNRTRTALWRAAGVRIGPRSLVQGPLRITGIGDTCASLSIGSFTIITGPLHLDLGAPVHIGDFVRIGHDVSLLTISHAIGPTWLRAGTSEFGAIAIGDGVWIASRVTVLPNVTIGKGAVVAAGSVVTHDVPENTLVAGVPARVIRSLNEDGPREMAVSSQAEGQ